MILSICDSAEVLSVMRIVKIVIEAIRIVVPIILIVTTMISFAGAVASGEQQSAMKVTIKRVIAALIIFFIPLLIKTTVRLIDGSDGYYKCISNATREGVSNARVSAAQELITNASNTLKRGNYLAAKAAVDRLPASERSQLTGQLQKVEAEVKQAEKERAAAREVAANKRDSERQSSSGSSSSGSSSGGSYSSGVSVTGKYTKTQIIDMTEEQVRAMSNAEFMDFIGSAAQLVYKERGGVLPSITVAQACLESGYGDHFETTSHNVYGLIGYPGNKPKVSKLRKFDNFYEATYYHATYFEEYSSVYSGFLQACNNKDPMTAASYLYKYAGGSQSYGPNIQSIIRTYDLGKYDNI